jgi:hypothetical protein
VNLEELDGGEGGEGETERKVYAVGYSSELLRHGLTGASRRPMRLHELQVSPFLRTEEGRCSIDMRYTTLSGSPAPPQHPPPPPPPMWSSCRSAAAPGSERTVAAPLARRRSICEFSFAGVALARRPQDNHVGFP